MRLYAYPDGDGDSRSGLPEKFTNYMGLYSSLPPLISTRTPDGIFC